MAEDAKGWRTGLRWFSETGPHEYGFGVPTAHGEVLVTFRAKEGMGERDARALQSVLQSVPALQAQVVTLMSERDTAREQLADVLRRAAPEQWKEHVKAWLSLPGESYEKRLAAVLDWVFSPLRAVPPAAPAPSAGPAVALTGREGQVLLFVSKHITDKGYPPGVRDVANHMGWKSTHFASQCLDALSRKQCVTWTPKKARTLAITEGGRLALAQLQAEAVPRG